MPKTFKFTRADGKIVRVTGPDEATEADALAIARPQLEEVPAKPVKDLPAWVKFLEKTDVLGLGDSLNRGGDAVTNLAKNWRGAAGGDAKTKVVSDLLRALGEPYGKAFGTVGMMSNPIGTVGAVGTGLLGAGAAGMGAELFGAGPGVAQAAQDVGGLASGALGLKGANAAQRGIAPELVSSAAKARPVNRQWGKELGKATLEETAGNTPDAIVASASERLGQLRNVKEGLLRNAPEVERAPILRELAKWLQTSRDQGSSTLGAAVKEMEPSIRGNTETGAMYGPRMNALASDEALQGFGKDHVRFIEGRTPAANEMAKAMRGVWRDANVAAAPETAPINKRMTDLADVPDLFRKVGNQAGATENMVHRATTPTGAMAPALAAMMHGGAPAGILALIAQEGIASPSVKVALARALWKAGGGKKVSAP